MQTVTITEQVIRVMERHLHSPLKFAPFITVAALSMLLCACGGGGGGGGDFTGRQVARAVRLDTTGTTPVSTRVSARTDAGQRGATTGSNTRRTPTPDNDAGAQGLGSASLSWLAPSKRADGSSLSMSEIAGYRIYYGASSGEYDSVLPVDDPYTFTIRIDELPVGTYYFVMTTVDTGGMESGYSGETVKIVRS